MKLEYDRERSQCAGTGNHSKTVETKTEGDERPISDFYNGQWAPESALFSSLRANSTG